MRSISPIALLLLLAWTACMAASPTSQPAPWVADARASLVEASQATQELRAVQDRLTQLGMPAAREGLEKQAKWYGSASEETRKALRTIGPLEHKISHSLIDLWLSTSIGEPIAKLAPGELLQNTSAVIAGYERKLGEYDSVPFEVVYFREAHGNLVGLSGPYYRQAARAMIAHVSIEGDVSPLSFIDPYCLEPVSNTERDWVRNLIGEWYYGHLAYGYRWQTKNGKLLLCPATRDAFVLNHPRP